MVQTYRCLMLIILLAAGVAAGDPTNATPRPSPSAPEATDTKTDEYVRLARLGLRTVTEFRDVYAVSERSQQGGSVTVLNSKGGDEIARLIHTGDGRLIVRGSLGWSIEAHPSPTLKVTPDWLNEQVFSIWKESLGFQGGPPFGPLSFDGYFFRVGNSGSNQGSIEHRRSIASAIQSMMIEWSDLVAEARRSDHEPTGQATFQAELREKESQRRLGQIEWYSQLETLAWTFPGISTGHVNKERLAQAHLDEWPFEPTMAWAILQAFRFQERAGLQTRSEASIGLSREEPSRCASTWNHRYDFEEEQYRRLGALPGGESESPRSISANNEVGCDGMHFLDGTFLRKCCDDHDHCYGYDEDGNPYVPDPCGWKSWLFLEGWRCTGCNASVIWCFATGGLFNDNPYDQDPNADPCGVPLGHACPADCHSCVYH